MAQDKGSTRGHRSAREPEEDPKPLMAEINTNAGVDPVMGKMGDDSPRQLVTSDPVPTSPPAYTPPPDERWGRLMSRVNFPLEVQHQEGAIRLSPRAVVRVDGNKITHVDGKMILPKGANFVPDRR